MSNEKCTQETRGEMGFYGHYHTNPPRSVVVVGGPGLYDDHYCQVY